MVAVVTASHRDRFHGTLAHMHRDRKAVFVDALNWDVPVVGGEFEIDDYDTEAAIYLVARDAASGNHLGSVRLVCTAGPHLLGDTFAFLCHDGVPVGETVWEITRLCTAPALGSAEALQVRMRLVIALIEHALANGIVRYTMMTHIAYLPTLLAVGWNITPLGLPAEIAGESIGALAIDIDAPTLTRLRQRYGFERPVLAGGVAAS